MKDEKIILIVSVVVILFIIFFTWVVLIGIEISTSKNYTIKTDCYDNNNNKIDNLTCTKNISCGDLSYYFKDKDCEIALKNGKEK